MITNPLYQPPPVPIHGIWFTGPFKLDAVVETYPRSSGTYAVACLTPFGFAWLDAGESGEMGLRLQGHERSKCWQAKAAGFPLYFFVHFDGSPFGRWMKEQHVRRGFEADGFNLCGTD